MSIILSLKWVVIIWITVHPTNFPWLSFLEEERLNGILENCSLIVYAKHIWMRWTMEDTQICYLWFPFKEGIVASAGRRAGSRKPLAVALLGIASVVQSRFAHVIWGNSRQLVNSQGESVESSSMGTTLIDHFGFPNPDSISWNCQAWI